MKHLDPFKAELKHLWLPQYPLDPKPISIFEKKFKRIEKKSIIVLGSRGK